MISTSVRVETDLDASGAVKSAIEDYTMDAATEGSNAMQQRVAQQATDTGQLLKSHVPPERLPDGTVITGFSADYASEVSEGTPPHWVPIQPLLGWARRVLGDESAAYGVQKKIAEEGTEGVHIKRKGVEAIKSWMTAHSVGEYVEDRL